MPGFACWCTTCLLLRAQIDLVLPLTDPLPPLHLQLDTAVRAAAGRLKQCAAAGLLAAPVAAIEGLLSCNTDQAPLVQVMVVLAALVQDGSEVAAVLQSMLDEAAAAQSAEEPEAAAAEPAGAQPEQPEQPASGAAEVPPPPPTAEQLAVQRSRALAMRRCANALCTNLGGTSEAELKVQRCSACKAVRFCSLECSRAAWRSEHRLACRVLQQEAAAAAAAADEAG